MAGASKQNLPPIVLVGLASLLRQKAHLLQHLQYVFLIFTLQCVMLRADSLDTLCWHLCRLQQLPLCRGRCCHPR